MKIIELFKFVEGTVIFTQTSAAHEVEYNGEFYTPQPMGRSELESKNEIQRANLDIGMDLDNPLAERYLRDPVDAVVSLTVFKQEILDNGTVTTATFWKGRLRSVRAGKSEVSMTFENFFTSLRRPGLRARYQKSCRHGVYSRGCGLDMETWGMVAQATSATKNVVIVDSIGSIPDGALRGGMLKSPDGTIRFITGHNGTTVTLLREFGTLNAAIEETPGGVQVVLYRGCAHNPSACDELGNLDNYGGFPWIPDINPFAGNSIA